MPPPTSPATPARALWAVTIGLAVAYLVAALAFARPGNVIDFGWPNRFNFGGSLLLLLLALYGTAWLLDRCPARPQPRSAGWRGAAYGVLALLAVVVLVGGWNAAQEAIRFAPFPGTTQADFQQHVVDCCYDYILKPLAYIMPLGSLVAAPLGWWVGRRRADAA